MAKKLLTATHPTRNETIKPIRIKVIPSKASVSKSFKSVYPEAAVIVGIANKNEKLIAVSRFIPRSIPPKIVLPERETPGINERA